MPKNKLKIGWQKYEDLVEKQLSSPLMKMFMANFETEQDSEEAEHPYAAQEDAEEYGEAPLIMPFSEKFMDDVNMTANFDCWMGHTNFDLTKEIKHSLDHVEGVEVLKICSRYRFFIGIGRMFDFKDVRKNIENILLKEE